MIELIRYCTLLMLGAIGISAALFFLGISAGGALHWWIFVPVYLVWALAMTRV